jgi:hypothetical protein
VISAIPVVNPHSAGVLIIGRRAITLTEKTNGFFVSERGKSEG